ncbi:MAG: D-alanyl-D-alanine carboxypeptidase [Rhodospirillaceae bacterium]|nr:D-alanyl-D-alanine carboxypeptidase [Rhodospirillaceae bacterium]
MDRGAVLHAVNPDKSRYPASLTKIMTLYMVFEGLKKGTLTLQQRLHVSKRAAGMAPSSLRLVAGSTITLEAAIYAIVTKSANDAAVVIAETLGGTESKFALRMTKKARKLGMRKTTFRNASGLPNRRQKSTARDMATLARHLISDFPLQYRYFSTKKYTFRGKTLKNHNNLLRTYRGADGIKTGYICASGFNLVASAERDGRRLIGVVFGGRSSKTRDREMARLLDKGFEKAKTWSPPRIAGLIKTKKFAPRTPKPAFKPKPAVAKATNKPKPTVSKTAVSKTAVAKPAAPKSIGNKSTGNKAPSDILIAFRATPPDPNAPAWSIQVGAYQKSKPARRAAQRAVKRIRNLTEHTRIHIAPHQEGDNLIYRARLVGFTKSHAQAACKRLKRRRMGCVAIAPVEAPVS